MAERQNGMAISLGPPLPTGSSALPAPRRTGVGSLRCPGLLGLARGGVCLAIAVANDPVCSYHTFSPLPGEGRGASWKIEFVTRTLNPLPRSSPLPWRFVSVALSLPRPSPVEAVGVTHHRVLSCSDFPRDRQADPATISSAPREHCNFENVQSRSFLKRRGDKRAEEKSSLNHFSVFLVLLAFLAPRRFNTYTFATHNWYLLPHDRQRHRTRSDRLGR